MDVHSAELALEPLPGVPLHDLAADVTRGDVLEGVLCKLVVGLKDRGRLHLDIEKSNFKKRPTPNLNHQLFYHSVHRLDNKSFVQFTQMKTNRKRRKDT